MTFDPQSRLNTGSIPIPQAPPSAPTMEIELFEGKSIDALRACSGLASDRIFPKPARRTATPRAGGPMTKANDQAIRLPKRVSRGRCSCGVCKVCEENARWEAVFNAKFADPTYYADRGVRVGSPLSDFSR